jgi:hypothetical protein
MCHSRVRFGRGEDLDIQASTKVSNGPSPVEPTVGGDTPARLEEQGLSREAYAMLAQANLLRMRGRWPEAIEKCMAALRLSPEHPSAQSLLGDIYENQGRLDDAIQWYRMALDVQPDSPADRIKLAHLLERKSRDLTTPPIEKPVTSNSVQLSSASLSSIRWLQGWRTDPDRLLRRVATLTGLLAVLIVLAALLITHHANTLSFLAPVKLVDAPPVVVSPVAPASVTDTPSSPAANPPIADPSEATLLSALQAAPGLSGQGLTVVSAQIDPRASRLTVTASFLPSPGATVSRDLILHQATRVLQAAAQQGDPQAFTQMTVRCLLASSGGGSTPLVFTADASRGFISALNPNLDLLTTDQITSAYTNLWWGPMVAQ